MFQKNIKIIEKKNLELYFKILKIEQSEKYKIVESKNGLPNIEIENNKYVHSRYDPKNEAKKWVEGIDDRDNDAIIVIGLGLGYYLDELIFKFPKCNIIVIEPDLNIFYNFIKVRDVNTYYNNSKITFLISLEDQIVSAIINEHLYYDSLRRPCIVETPIYRNLYNERIQDLYEDIRRNLIEFRGNLSTKLFFTNFWIDNGIRNMINIIKLKNNYSAKLFSDLFENIPVIIVSAGPSLEGNMHMLKNLYEKSLILAVGSAVNIMEKNNIRPHMIMGIDGSEEETKIFESLDSHDSIFLYSPTVHYKSPELYNGTKAWFGLNVQPYINNILDKHFGLYPIMESGPSVANIALDFSIKVLNSKLIIFIGQDLAYTNDKIYADGYVNSYEHEKVRDYSNREYVLTKDIYGNDIYTSKSFLNMQKWFEDYVSIREVGERIINCTEGGIGILGVRNKKLKEVVDKYCDKIYDIGNMIEQCISNYTEMDSKGYEEELKLLKISINKCNQVSTERVKEIQELYKSLDNKRKGEKFNKKFDNILKLGNKIEKENGYKTFIEPLIKSYIDITTFNANRMVKNTIDKDEARYKSLKTLLNQYLVIDNSIKVAQKAFEELL